MKKTLKILSFIGALLFVSVLSISLEIASGIPAEWIAAPLAVVTVASFVLPAFGINTVGVFDGITAFALTAGHTKTCSVRSGGIKNIWIANRDDIDTAGFTLTGDDYSTVTMVATKVFYKFEFDQDTGSFSSNMTSEAFSISCEHMLNFFLGRLDPTMRQRLQEIANQSTCGLVAIVEDNNGTKWVFGYSENHKSTTGVEGRPLRLDSGNMNSGAVFTDNTGAEMALKSVNNEYPRQYTGTVPV